MNKTGSNTVLTERGVAGKQQLESVRRARKVGIQTRQPEQSWGCPTPWVAALTQSLPGFRDEVA